MSPCQSQTTTRPNNELADCNILGSSSSRQVGRAALSSCSSSLAAQSDHLKMVLLDEIRSARQEGYDVVQDTLAWLDTDEYNNDAGAILLSDICNDHGTIDWDVDIARLLLSRGVDANYCEEGDGWTLFTCRRQFFSQ